MIIGDHVCFSLWNLYECSHSALLHDTRLGVGSYSFFMDLTSRISCTDRLMEGWWVLNDGMAWNRTALFFRWISMVAFRSLRIHETDCIHAYEIEHCALVTDLNATQPYSFSCD